MTTILRALEQLDRENRLQHLAGANRGIEREGLRTTADGNLAPTAHPRRLGSALCHPYVTTDFAEPLLELISPIHHSPRHSIRFMQQLHGWLTRTLDEELLWPASMPCRLPGEEQIPIARYGTSNIARMKEIYREGLSWRYGRTMQTIAGIHYNFSPVEAYWTSKGDGSGLKEVRSTGYMGLIRNFQRNAWLLLYLFGASPMLDTSFLQGRAHALQALGTDTLGLKHATSLRMGDLGYQNNAQASLNVCYNTLPSYLDSLQHAISTPLAEYEKIGVLVDGHYRQLNSNILQIENEYYSAIRPKRVTRSGERPIHALRERGIEYVEIRCLDVDPFTPLGIDTSTMRSLDLFLWHCLLSDAPTLSPAECRQSQERLALAVRAGRDPDLQLPFPGGRQSLRVAAGKLLDELEPLAECLQALEPAEDYLASLQLQRSKVEHPERTPSGQMMAALQHSQAGFSELGLQLAGQHRQTLLGMATDSTAAQAFAAAANKSIAEQRELEAQDAGSSLADYLDAYFSQA